MNDLIRSWTGRACRHIPDGSRFGVLDIQFAGRARDNRWSRPGEPTLYVAGDYGVLIAEFARHLREERTPTEGQRGDLPPAGGGGAKRQRGLLARRIYDLDLAIPHTLDLRDRQVIAGLSLAGAPRCFLDREVARATADFLRRTTIAEALLLPSMAFLDDPERWIMAIFLEKLPDGIEGAVISVAADGVFRHED